MSTSPSLRFERLELGGWRQFSAVDMVLHPQLTVITGANGAGKSTLLNLFSQHFGFAPALLSTPRLTSGAYIYWTDIVEMIKGLVGTAQLQENTAQIGSITYSNGLLSQISVPKQTGVQYNVGILNQQHIMGVRIGSHRPIPTYQQVANIPTQAMLPEQAYTNYDTEIRHRYSNSYTQFSPTYRMKEALISMATFGAGNQYVQRNDEVLASFRGFVEVLRAVLPESLGFEDLSIRTPDVVLMTRSGEFMIDAASGGIMTLIDLAWQIFLYSRRADSFVVTIDEPENHLHPSMQRSLMGNLIKAFPKAQFIVATHSPFIVSAVRESRVYVLQYNDDGPGVGESSAQRKVVSIELDTVNKAGSAAEVLRDVLGVRATVPEWVERGLDEILTRYRGHSITSDSLRELRADLARLGYGDMYPEALAALTSGR